MFLTELFFPMVLKVTTFFLLSLWSFMFNVFCFITKFILRLKTDCENSEERDENFGLVLFSINDRVDHNYHGFGETEKEDAQETFETNGSVLMEDELVSPESKYQFLLSKDFSLFVTDQQVISFTVEEMFVDSNDDVFFSSSQILDKGSNKCLEIEDHLFNLSSSLDESFHEHTPEIDFTEKSLEILQEQIAEEINVQEKADEDHHEKYAEVDVSKESDKSLNQQIAEVDGSEEADEGFQQQIAEVYGSEETDESLEENIAEFDGSKTDDSDGDMHVEENVEETEEKLSPCEILKNQEDSETFEISVQQVEVFDKDEASFFYKKLDPESSLIDDESPSAHPEVVFTNEEEDPDDEYIEINPYVQPLAGDDDLADTFFLRKIESFEVDGAHMEELDLLDDFKEEISENMH